MFYPVKLSTKLREGCVKSVVTRYGGKTLTIQTRKHRNKGEETRERTGRKTTLNNDEWGNCYTHKIKKKEKTKHRGQYAASGTKCTKGTSLKHTDSPTIANRVLPKTDRRLLFSVDVDTDLNKLWRILYLEIAANRETFWVCTDTLSP